MASPKATTILLIAMLAVAGASARDLQQEFGSGGSCSAHANSGVIKKSKDDFATAVARAVKVGCSKQLSADDLVADYIDYYRVSARAIVRVWTSAFAQCTTWGPNSFGCASAFAYAKGQETAYIDLFSIAIAKAANNCYHCDPKAAAKVFAQLVVKLFASAKAKSFAKVCVGPNETAYAYAFSSCNSQVLAHGFAYAHAYAAIQGGCTDLSANAYAVVDNYVKADPYCMCTGWAEVCANGTCVWKYDENAYITAAKGTPSALAFFEAECKAFAAQIV